MDEEDGFLTLRDGTLRKNSRDSVTMGPARLERITIIDKDDGEIMQLFTINYNGESIAENSWELPPEKGSKDQQLKMLDYHWGKLKEEFKEIIEQADFYYHIKATKDGTPHNPLLKDFLQGVAGPLLHKKMPDEDFFEGRIIKEYYPLSAISQRLTALRIASFPEKIDRASDDPALKETMSTGVELDRFEKEIMALDGHVAQATVAYDKYVTGAGDDEGDDLQLTAEGLDEGDEEWRGDQHPVSEQSYGETEIATRDDAEASDITFDKLNLEDMEFEDDDLDTKMEFYTEFLVDFTNSANRLWMDAVDNISRHKPVTHNAHELKEMKAAMDDANEVYQEFKEMAQATLPHTYDLIPLFDLIEDPDNGPAVRMQRLVDMASKPRQLEAIIRKNLNKQIDKGDSLAM